MEEHWAIRREQNRSSHEFGPAPRHRSDIRHHGIELVWFAGGALEQSSAGWRPDDGCEFRVHRLRFRGTEVQSDEAIRRRWDCIGGDIWFDLAVWAARIKKADPQFAGDEHWRTLLPVTRSAIQIGDAFDRPATNAFGDCHSCTHRSCHFKLNEVHSVMNEGFIKQALLVAKANYCLFLDSEQLYLFTAPLGT